jgi:anaerobic ribonucleoside-triphosphate reductase
MMDEYFVEICTEHNLVGMVIYGFSIDSVEQATRELFPHATHIEVYVKT